MKTTAMQAVDATPPLTPSSRTYVTAPATAAIAYGGPGRMIRGTSPSRRAAANPPPTAANEPTKTAVIAGRWNVTAYCAPTAANRPIVKASSRNSA